MIIAQHGIKRSSRHVNIHEQGTKDAAAFKGMRVVHLCQQPQREPAPYSIAAPPEHLGKRYSPLIYLSDLR